MEGTILNRKRKQKGFTLIELIIVLAIFSIILTLVLSFIDPVAKLMSKASIKERTAAYVDNIEEYVDNSIHYAKFIRVYEGGYCLASDETEGVYTPLSGGAALTGEQAAVKSFVDWFLGGVISPPDDSGNVYPAEGKVRVMKLINNDVDLDGDAVADLEAGHIYESVYDFTAAESYEKLEYEADGITLKKREVHIRPGGSDSSITPVQQNVAVINSEHFKDYNYYYKMGFYNLEPIESTSPAYKDAGKTSYYSWLVPMKDSVGNEITYDSNTGKNFALNVVAYQNGGKEAHTYNDGTNDVTVDIFKSPCHMSTASMAFINAIKTNEASSAPFYRLKTKSDGSLDLKDGNVQFESINSVNMGLAFRLMKPQVDANGDGNIDSADKDGNIYIVYILPEEIKDTQIVYK